MSGVARSRRYERGTRRNWASGTLSAKLAVVWPAELVTARIRTHINGIFCHLHRTLQTTSSYGNRISASFTYLGRFYFQSNPADIHSTVDSVDSVDSHLLTEYRKQALCSDTLAQSGHTHGREIMMLLISMLPRIPSHGSSFLPETAAPSARLDLNPLRSLSILFSRARAVPFHLLLVNLEDFPLHRTLDSPQ